MEEKHNGSLIKIKLVGFSERTVVGVSSILTLAEDQLDRHWQIVSQDQADFYLINGQLKAKMASDGFLRILPRRQCIFAMTRIDDAWVGEGRQFPWGDSEVPSLRRLVDFLNRLGDEFVTQASETSVSTEISAITEQPETSRFQLEANKSGSKEEFFDPTENLLGHLLAGQEQPLAFCLSDQPLEFHQLYVDSATKHYFSPFELEQLKPYFLATDTLRVIKLSARQFAEVRTDKTLKPRPLGQLIWYTAFCCSRGRVIAGYRHGDIVHLKRWPDIKLQSKDLIRLAAFMHNNAADLETVQASTKVPLAVVHDYYNACKVCDLIEHTQAAYLHAKRDEHEQMQLFAEIGKRLNQVRQSIARKNKDGEGHHKP